MQAERCRFEADQCPPNILSDSTMLAESEADEELVCETSVSGFKSRRSTQLEGAAEWTATGLENQGGLTPRGSIPPPSSPPEAGKRGTVLITQW